jgi:flavin-dependent dehydrogenase
LHACVTSAGRRVEACWYLDASGTARVLARALEVPIVEYGRKKVCLWTYFDGAPLDAGTTFFLDSRQPYLSWVWDIPISPQRTSVGLVVPADRVQADRRRGLTTPQILAAALAPYERFAKALASQPDLAVEAMSFQPFVTSRVCGPNWMMVGEAASMPDPLTGNGVTSGMRHARYAAAAIVRARGQAEIAPADRRCFSRHVHRLGHAFNSHIERVIYQPPVRRGLGMYTATLVYTSFAFFMNALYTRFDPTGRVAMAVFDGLFVAARVWVAAWIAVGRVACRLPGAADGDVG